MKPGFIVTIGLEVHVQLKTRSKMFCACRVEFGAEPNTHTCPVCLGMPGALPVMNLQALKLTALSGLMLNCSIPEICKFDRKHYFYPDMPKNYQITQFDQPICLGGGVPLHDLAYPKDHQKKIATPNKIIGLTRIHLEEDVAKSFHFETSTGIDFNRAGSPLMEIVSEPDIASPEEAFAYLTALRQVLVYGNVSDADMDKGQMRVDCNISVRPDTQKDYNAKIELKNLNTVSGVRRALAFEIARQTQAVEEGVVLKQETRRWDDDAGETYLMRIKETSADYRYFPDPDLLPVKTEAFMPEVRTLVPELPAQKRDRYVSEYSVSEYDASVIADDLALCTYFEAAVKAARKPKGIANWILNDLQSALSTAGLTIEASPIQPRLLDELVNLLDDGKINGNQAREVFADMFATGKTAAAIVEAKGLQQESDSGAIEALCLQIISENPKSVEDYRAGKVAAVNFLKGQVMKLSKGKANPAMVGDLLIQLLGQ